MTGRRLTVTGLVLAAMVAMSAWVGALALPLDLERAADLQIPQPNSLTTGADAVTQPAPPPPPPLPPPPGPVPDDPSAPPPPPPPPPDRDASAAGLPDTSATLQDDPLKVGGDIRPPRKILNVNPIYPEEAQVAGIQGVVILEIIIDGDGAVRDVQVLRSIPELDQAAMDAVWQWRYVPTLLNGRAVEVQMTVTVNFTLTQ